MAKCKPLPATYFLIIERDRKVHLFMMPFLHEVDNHVWQLENAPPIPQLPDLPISVSIHDALSQHFEWGNLLILISAICHDLWYWICIVQYRSIEKYRTSTCTSEASAATSWLEERYEAEFPRNIQDYGAVEDWRNLCCIRIMQYLYTTICIYPCLYETLRVVVYGYIVCTWKINRYLYSTHDQVTIVIYAQTD